MSASVRSAFMRGAGRDLIPLATGPDDASDAVPTTADPAQPSPIEIAILVLLLGASVALVIWTAAMAYLATPFSDGYDWIDAVFSAERRDDWLVYLWSPHTEQRIPIARLFEALDVEWVRGRAPTFLIGAALFVGAGFAALTWTVGASATSLRLRAWLIALSGCVAANVALAEDLAIPGFAVYAFVAGPALAACALLASSRRDGLTLPLTLTLVAAALASGGNAAGLAIWPVLIGVAIVQRRSPTQLLTLVAAALVCFGALEAGLGLPSRSLGADTSKGGSHILKMAIYFADYGGLPWSRAIRPAPLGAAFGLAIEITAGAAPIVAVRRSESADRFAALRAAGAAMIAFGLATAALAAVGRVDELPQPVVPTRYVAFASLIQIGIILCCAEPLEALLRRRSRIPITLLAAASAVSIGIQIPRARSFVRVAERIRAAGGALDAGVETPLPGVVLYPDANRARRIRAQIKARGLPY